MDNNRQSALLYDLGELKKISRGSEAFLNKMLLIFLDQLSVTIKQLKSANEIRDFAQLKRLTHKFKPALANLGVHSVADVIMYIEIQADILDPEVQQEVINNSEKLITILRSLQIQLAKEIDG